MESLQDAFSKDELREFSNRVEDTVSNVNYVVEPKIDGLSVSLEYRDGVFLRGSTRGNGDVGEDVSGNLRVIHNIPLKLNKSIPYIVRGEVYMPKKSFERVVDRQIINGEKPLNPRNAAAGSLRQKDSSVAASRGFDIFVFNIQQIEGVRLSSHKESLDFIKELGFNELFRHIKRLTTSKMQLLKLTESVKQEVRLNMTLTVQLLRLMIFHRGTFWFDCKIS